MYLHLKKLCRFTIKDIILKSTKSDGVVYVVSVVRRVQKKPRRACNDKMGTYVVYHEGQQIKSANTLIHARVKTLSSRHKVMLIMCQYIL